MRAEKTRGNSMAKKSVQDYITGSAQWCSELSQLRALLLAAGLDETIKWGAPCYTYRGQNVVGMSGFKSYFGLWFYLGARIDDSADVLINAQEGETRDLRQWRMRSAADIDEPLIRRYLAAAMRLVDLGEKPTRVTRRKSVACPELTSALAADPDAKSAFMALTPGRQREWAEHIKDAKRASTRAKRLAEAITQIRAGHGLHDRYRR